MMSPLMVGFNVKGDRRYEVPITIELLELATILGVANVSREGGVEEVADVRGCVEREAREITMSDGIAMLGTKTIIYFFIYFIECSLQLHFHFRTPSPKSSSCQVSAKEKESSHISYPNRPISHSLDPSIIPSMASSSTSSIHKSLYDVFLSFRGEDTRKNFVDHLYHALQEKNIHTYKDDERINKGKRIGDELIKSIEGSKYFIIVFSKNYASSSWCLDELVKIMDCHKKTIHIAYPVFYDVEPSEVRKQSGTVGEAFARHENEEAAGKWREALKEAADLAGWELKNTAGGHEAKCIRQIIEKLSLELRSINVHIDKNLVGMETRVNDIVSALETDSDDIYLLMTWVLKQQDVYNSTREDSVRKSL
ncbi:hypothetical protein L1887_39247 [Cichorium endivia]|nr:hypothetical protein L1887_39247 [Cichorium endivia]